MKRILAWFASHHQSMSIFLASLSLIVASGAAISSFWLNKDDKDYRVKQETLAFFLQYSPATKSRGIAARDARLAGAFNTESAIQQGVVLDVENDNDGTNDYLLRSNLIDLVNYNEMLCMGRQKGILDKDLFDLQFKEIIKADYRVLRHFLAYTVQNKDASYPFWAEALKEWGIDSSDLVN